MQPAIGKLYETQNGIKVLCISVKEASAVVYDYTMAEVYEIKNDMLSAEWAPGKDWEGYVQFNDVEAIAKGMEIVKGEAIDWDYLKSKQAKIKIQVV